MKTKIILLFFIIIIEGIYAQNVLPNYNGVWTDPRLNNPGRSVIVTDLIPFYQDRLDILRNEIYARYGHPFLNPKYREYFISQNWYVEKHYFSESWLTEEDRRRIELILSIEKPPCYGVINEAKMNNIIYTGTYCDLLFPRFTSQYAVFRWREDTYNGYPERIENRSWIVIGDWLITYSQMGDSRYQVHNWRINSSAREVGDRGTEGGSFRAIDKNIWEKFLSAQEPIKLQYTKNW